MLQLIRNADLYTPQHHGIQHLLIAAGKVVWVGAKPPELSASLLSASWDLEGRRLIPGLIDGHSHLTGGGGESGYASRVPPPALSRYTTAGVTTVVGVLGTDDVNRDTGSLVAHARGLCEEGITAYCHTGGYHLPLKTLTGCARADIVHVDRIIGIGELAISDHRSSQPTLAEFLRVASDAHVAGMMTGKAGILHLHLGNGVRSVDLIQRALMEAEIPPRTYHPTHVNRRTALFDDAVALAKQGCSIDITAFPDNFCTDGLTTASALMTYLASDAPAENVTISSDGGGCLPVFDETGATLHLDIGQPSCLSDGLRQLLEQGVALETLLPAFTSNVARLLRLTTKGTIAEGCDADFVVLDDAHNVWGTMAMGSWHLYDGKLQQWGSFEPRID